jgi:hypothetical protein
MDKDLMVLVALVLVVVLILEAAVGVVGVHLELKAALVVLAAKVVYMVEAEALLVSVMVADQALSA